MMVSGLWAGLLLPLERCEPSWQISQTFCTSSTFFIPTEMNQIVFSARPPLNALSASKGLLPFSQAMSGYYTCLLFNNWLYILVLLLHSQNNPDFNSPWSKRKHTITQISTKASKHGPHCYFGSNWDIGLWSFLVHFSSVLPTKVPQRRSKVVTRKVQNLEVHFQALNEEFGPFLGGYSFFQFLKRKNSLPGIYEKDVE